MSSQWEKSSNLNLTNIRWVGPTCVWLSLCWARTWAGLRAGAASPGLVHVVHLVHVVYGCGSTRQYAPLINVTCEWSAPRRPLIRWARVNSIADAPDLNAHSLGHARPGKAHGLDPPFDKTAHTECALILVMDWHPVHFVFLFAM